MRTTAVAPCLAGVVLSVAVAIAPTASAAQTGGWQAALARQLSAEKDCTLAFFSRIGVVVQNGREVVVARAHCEDGRAFEAARIAPAERFDLRACGASEERAC